MLSVDILVIRTYPNKSSGNGLQVIITNLGHHRAVYFVKYSPVDRLTVDVQANKTVVNPEN